MKPIYAHDCDNCTYLDTIEYLDLYFCPQGGMPTILARYGNNGQDYSSGLMRRPYAGHKGTEIRFKGQQLAIERGLLTQEDVERYG